MNLMKHNLVERGLAEYKDAEKDMDENKDLMKNDSVQSLSYPHLPTPELPTSVALPMSNLDELINNVRSSSSSSSLSLSLLGGGWVNMNLMKHNLVERGLAEYKEEDDEDDLTLLINSAKFDIGRATEVGSLGVGK